MGITKLSKKNNEKRKEGLSVLQSYDG